MKVNASKKKSSDYEQILLLTEEKNPFVPGFFKPFITSGDRKKLGKNQPVIITAGKRRLGIFPLNKKEAYAYDNIEKIRRFAASFYDASSEGDYGILCSPGTSRFLISEAAIALVLSSYTFQKFKRSRGQEKKTPALYLPFLSETELERIRKITEAVFLARDWVNTPVNHLSAPRLAEEFRSLSKKVPLKVTVLDKKAIQKMGMGGLLAVNQGSVDEPRFTIMEYRPEKRKNKKSLVLVGKGLVYDTGGLSLKPTPGSMDTMKCDMAGGAVVAAAVYAAACLNLPVHVIALIPSTDNRPGFNAFAPGDIIRMMDGTWVEMLNSDAEGRMILADALHYAKSLKPELVLEFSTLTGAAANAIGHYGMVGMGILPENHKKKIFESARRTGERVAEFPFWDDYDELLKSPIADFKNIGGPVAGAITAGRFLKKFTDYPFFHFDIAGPAFIQKRFHYMPAGGTGFGIRFLIDFMENF